MKGHGSIAGHGHDQQQECYDVFLVQIHQISSSETNTFTATAAERLFDSLQSLFYDHLHGQIGLLSKDLRHNLCRGRR